MLLQRLKEYADKRLPDQAPALYGSTPVATIVRLHEDGKPFETVPLSNIDPEARRGTRAARGRETIAPEIRRSSNLQPLLLCDTGEYTFGLADQADQQNSARSIAAHETYIALLEACAAETGEPSVLAVQRFYERGGLTQIELPPDLNRKHKITFEVVGADGTIERPIDLPSVRAFWLDLHDPPADTIGQCLVCAEQKPLLETLPGAIKGIPGAPTTGVPLISAKHDVYWSYGMTKALNSPICRECAEAVTRALNHLLADRSSRLIIGDTAIVFWSREGARLPDLAAQLRGPGEQPAVDILHELRGRGADIDLDEPFYAVMLGASLGRVIVRDWIDTTAGHLERNLERWFAMQRIADRGAPPDAPRPIGIFALAASLVRVRRNDDDAPPDPATRRRIAAELSSELTRGLFRAAVLGEQLPSGLATQAAIRCRAEQRVTRPRAALIKMSLPDHPEKEDYMVALEPDHPEVAYHCGRLLAVIESVQQMAIPGLSTTVTDRFWGSASTRPALAFATLLRGARPHLQRLRRDRPGLYYNRERLIAEIIDKIADWPTTLTLQEQALFGLGYYHQQTSERQRPAARTEEDNGNQDAEQEERAEQGGTGMSDAATDTITKLVHDPTKRHDFVLLIDVKDGNPNGDPDAGNMPRIDPETMQGLMSAESLKRKVRDYVDITEGDDRLKIYVQHGEFLADRRRNAVERRAAAAGVEDPPPRLAADFMCEEFFDVRMFGAVMSFKEANAGQVRGPMQVTQARTIDPIVSIDFTLTAPAQNRSDIDRSLVADGDSAPDAGTPAHGTLGRKSTVAYGLYRASGIYNAHFAARTGPDEADLDIFWRALELTWDLDHSSARGEIACRGLYVFTHENPYGNAPAHRLMELIKVPPSTARAPRSFSDYAVESPPDGPLDQFPGVTLTGIVR